MAEKLLEVKNLRTEFKRDKTWVTAVNNVSFSIQPGEILGLVGESGCGKTTFGRTVLQLYIPTSRKIIYAATDEKFAEAAREEALKVQYEMEHLLHAKGLL